MHVYIDDSGCGGFKLGRGSTSHLIMSACIFRQPEDITHAVSLVDECAAQRRLTNEFKYSERSPASRDAFFAAIAPARFKVRAIIIDKSRIHSVKLRSSPEALKSYAIRMLLTNNYGQIRNAKVFIDGNDTKAFGVGDADYLIRMVNRESPGTIARVRHVDSATSRPIQIADMVSGAINNAFRTDRVSDGTHLQTFRHRANYPEGTLWNFTR